MDNLSESQLTNIGLNLSLEDVASLCAAESKNGKPNPLLKICSDDKFWKMRFEKEYGRYGPPPRGVKYHTYYATLTKLWNVKDSATGEFLIGEPASTLLDPEQKLPDRIALLYPVPLLTLEGKQERNGFRGTVRADLLIISLPGFIDNGEEMSIVVHADRSSIKGNIPGIDIKIYYSNNQIIGNQPRAMQGKIEQLIEQLKISRYSEALADFPMFVEKKRVPVLIKRANELGYVTFNTKAKIDADPNLFENKMVKETVTVKPTTNYDYKPAAGARMNQVPVDEPMKRPVAPVSPKAEKKKGGLFSFLAPARADDFDDWMK